MLNSFFITANMESEGKANHDQRWIQRKDSKSTLKKLDLEEFMGLVKW
jgi:hypothetical protein